MIARPARTAPFLVVLLALAAAGACARGAAPTEPAPEPTTARAADVAALLAYVDHGWHVLRRSHADMAAAVLDPKLDGPPAPVYLARDEDPAAVRARLAAEIGQAAASIELRQLPEDLASIAEHGLLYLPEPYVVPGGRFNEMYGWDSYFIVLGLLRDGQVELARSMVDDFVYQVRHYGMILNANRTYYLSRSQPPFLTGMIRAVYQRTGDRTWLAATWPAIEAAYAYWVREPHLTPTTGLSRYHDLGHGPAPEVLASERDAAGQTHYDRVRAYFRGHAVPDYDARSFYDVASDRLTDLFYVADRSMRESGFDPSNRFGPFNAGVLSIDPVCLNTLLWVMERDAADILEELGPDERGTRGDPATWRRRADTRRRAIDRYLWDDARGLYLDYDFERGARRDYPFATTFFPLWAGLASPQQAARVVGNLALFERPGGLVTSTNRSGSQWDAPYGWAPLVMIAAEGLRRYGYAADADHISLNFLSLVLAEFIEHNAIFEKYDVEARDSATARGVRFGYSSNEIGFGWTNAAWTRLYDALPPTKRDAVRRLAGVGPDRAELPAPRP